MTEDSKGEASPDEHLIEKWKNAFYFTVPFSIAIGCLYQVGYWSIFGVNVLQFAGVSDVVSSALVPMLLLVLAMLTGALIARIIGKKFISKSEKTFQLKDFSESGVPEHDLVKIKRKLRKLKIFLWAIPIAILILLSISIILDLPIKWQLASMLISGMLVFFIEFEKIQLIPYLSLESQHVPLFLIFSILISSFGTGRSNGDQIREGNSYFYVVASSASLLIPKGRAPETALRFVGHVSEYNFFFDPLLKSTIIEKSQKESMLEVRSVTGSPISTQKKIADAYNYYIKRDGK